MQHKCRVERLQKIKEGGGLRRVCKDLPQLVDRVIALQRVRRVAVDVAGNGSAVDADPQRVNRGNGRAAQGDAVRPVRSALAPQGLGELNGPS